ncbi:bifunctional precorrin-2 dehydrogenase/sirohydrochlorin ferrochelatase [Alkalihalophilus marmarensis]|uniref:precorrin-2 dehydrogenase/sirohydrochlorin ferrochelatase family protein n=1 Tax=Alkalihalophilus marmarensis TaxID=521377 RepID=UPI002E21BC7B|nr:NAD(P)-dependent oxidoreductase [Alkalihalophilus marmarensis]
MNLPVMMDFEGREVTVVGGGRVACRQIKKLRLQKATIHLISPDITAEIEDLVRAGEVSFEKREVKPNESFSSDLVILATNDQELNEALYYNREARQWVYNASNQGKSDIHFPHTLQKGDLTITVSTNGASPLYAKELSKQIENQLPVDIEDQLLFLKWARDQIKSSSLNSVDKKDLLTQIVHPNWLNDKEREEKLLMKIKKASIK